MNWRVTYRGKDGRLAVEAVEAASRNDVFNVIAARGISAIRVEEARGKAKSGREANGFSKKALVTSLAAITAMAGVVCAFFFQNPAGGTASNAKERAELNLAPKSSTRGVNAQIATATGTTGTSTPKDAPADDGIPPRQRIVELISVTTNADGSVLERYRAADGKIRSRQSAPKPIFDNASDQLIAMAASGAESGHAMPPMPVMNNADEEFMKSLEKEIKIDEGDSDEVKALKQSVIAIRGEIRRLISEGHSFAEVLKTHRDIVNHGVAMRKEATCIIKEFVDNGDFEAANECLEKVNEVLSGMGIQRVEMPLTDEERRERIRARNRKGN